MIDIDTAMAAYDRHAKALKQANLINKTAVFEALAVAGITSVTVEFDGEGDSGQIESVIACAGDARVELPATPITLHKPSGREDALIPAEAPLTEAIESLCYDFLSQEHDGWENNDGAFGQFDFKVAERRVELEFNGRFSDSTFSTHVF
jgi:hypothetical protein